MPGSPALHIKSGRPDFEQLLSPKALGEGNASGHCMGVWTAGPKQFNLAASSAAYACGCAVDVQQMAFEL